MKTFYLVVFIIYVTNIFGQSPTNKVNGNSINTNSGFENDSSFKVVYVGKESTIKKTACFINGKFASKTWFQTLSPSLIDSVHVVDEKIEIDGTVYQQQMHIRTKDTYKPKLISLQALKEKYTNLKNEPAIFMIDGAIINCDYNTYVIDESCVFMMVVDKITTTKETIGLGFIKLLNKTDRNLKNDKVALE